MGKRAVRPEDRDRSRGAPVGGAGYVGTGRRAARKEAGYGRVSVTWNRIWGGKGIPSAWAGLRITPHTELRSPFAGARSAGGMGVGAANCGTGIGAGVRA